MIKKNNNVVTENYLDKRLAEHSQVIISAVGEVMDKKLGNIAKEINSLQTSLENKIDNTKQELKATLWCRFLCWRRS